jgi:hypothetical protein
MITDSLQSLQIRERTAREQAAATQDISVRITQLEIAQRLRGQIIARKDREEVPQQSG